MTTQYDGDLEKAVKEAELLQEKIGLLNRLREIDAAFGGAAPAAAPVKAPAKTTATPTTAPGDAAPKKRGRPKGSTNKPKTDATATAEGGEAPAPKKRGRPKGSTNKPKTDAEPKEGKSPALPAVLTEIGQQQNKPLTHAELVTLVRESGYTTKAKDFSNMVYQSLLKLVNRGVFRKAADYEENRAYEYIGSKAA